MLICWDENKIESKYLYIYSGIFFITMKNGIKIKIIYNIEKYNNF